MALVRNGQSLLASNSAVAAGQACCCEPGPCQCGGEWPEGTTVTAEFTVTYKEGQTNCTNGTATKSFELTFQGGQWIGSDVIDEVGPANLSAQMSCIDGDFHFLGVVNGADQNSLFDILGQPLAAAGGSASTTSSGTTVNGLCVPPPDVTLASFPQDPPTELSAEDVGMNFELRISIAVP
jgi:hypothetical protein